MVLELHNIIHLYKQAVLAHTKRYSYNESLFHVLETKCVELTHHFLQMESFKQR